MYVTYFWYRMNHSLRRLNPDQVPLLPRYRHDHVTINLAFELTIRTGADLTDRLRKGYDET